MTYTQLNRKLTKVTSDLIAAYDRLAQANRVTSAAEFEEYCAQYHLDYSARMDEARDTVDTYLRSIRASRAPRYS